MWLDFNNQISSILRKQSVCRKRRIRHHHVLDFSTRLLQFSFYAWLNFTVSSIECQQYSFSSAAKTVFLLDQFTKLWWGCVLWKSNICLKFFSIFWSKLYLTFYRSYLELYLKPNIKREMFAQYIYAKISSFKIGFVGFSFTA